MSINIRYKYIGISFNGWTVISEPFIPRNTKHKSCTIECNKCGNTQIIPLGKVTNEHYTYCSCHKLPKVRFKYKRTKSLFDYWMDRWDPKTHNKKVKKLPIFKGIVGQEYISSFTYIDSDVYDELSKIMWIKNNKYVIANLSKDNCDRLNIKYNDNKQNYIFLHRKVLKLNKDSDLLCDHINRITLDNRCNNLRKATYTQNSMNSNRGGQTGFRGIVIKQNGKTYKSTIWNPITKSNIYLGTSYSLRKCAIIYDMAAYYTHGEYAKFNYPKLVKYHKRFSFYSKVINKIIEFKNKYNA